MSPSPGRIAAAAMLPPLGVYLARGPGNEFLISCGLTLLGFIPGSVYAQWILFGGSDMLKKPKRSLNPSLRDPPPPPR